jgi:hypothetical protein
VGVKVSVKAQDELFCTVLPQPVTAYGTGLAVAFQVNDGVIAAPE